MSFYWQFAQIRPEHFVKGVGSIFFAAFEIGDGQKEEVLKIFEQEKWQNLSIENDINGLARVLTATPLKK